MSLSALSTEPMLYKTLSAAVYGIDASIIEVEVDISGVKTSEITFTLSAARRGRARKPRSRARSAERMWI